ncbi:MAG TPA: hypothetical protein VL983_07665 [Terriglobales bacterium]|nr:hypothetical protein [Terriglobales bacterium]
MRINAILLSGDSVPLASMVCKPFPKEIAPSRFTNVQIFGQSIVGQMIERLRRHDIRVTLIKSPGGSKFVGDRETEISVAANSREREMALAHAVNESAAGNSKTVLVSELSAYVEFDVTNAIQFHEARGQAVTPIRDSDGCIRSWLIDVAKWNSLRGSSQLLWERDFEGKRYEPFASRAYVNRLSNVFDLRKLVMDAFLGRCFIKPKEREFKPGVWMHESVRVDKSVRLVAPVYIGKNTAVGSGAIISRFTNIETGCRIGEGSVVSYASILPHTRVGKGLDISRAWVDGCEFTDLRRNVTLRVSDPNLITEASLEKWHVLDLHPRPEKTRVRSWQPEVEYSQYLTRAAGRLFEAFKGEA